MRALPQGTVTFLFTDIEGSTALLRELGDAYADLLAEHRRVLQEAVESEAGVVFGSEGDALFAVFDDAAAAVRAAGEAQRELAGLRVRVRMGIHTGRPAPADGGYVGIDLHRVARIAAAGHGGQVVLSDATRALAGGSFVFRDLGEHRLKDLPEPERLYQLGERDFAPLRSLSNTNLPAPATPLLGRRAELDELRELLARDEVRLVTLTGPGGAGKTRLAVALAADLVDAYPNGVFFVPLAAVSDPALVLHEIVQTLGIAEQPGEPLARTLARRLEDRTLLLVLDNVEQVVDAASELAELLERAPGVRVLATSREPLRVRGEREYALRPLAEPDALELFVERARAVVSDFELDGDEAAAREICERLDRLPLAIELVAARVKVLSPPAILDRLGERLSFVASTRRDLPARHRTLRGAVEWSYELLDEGERFLFARLGVFSGGWTLEAAEAACGCDLDVLASLLDKSLVRRDGEDRFAMLETIREYALERLEENGAEEARRAHAEYFLALAVEAETRLDGAVQLQTLNLLESEHDNLRAALGWALETGAGPEREALGLRLAAALGSFWYMHTHVREGASWLSRALAAAPEGDPSARARVMHHLGVLSDLRRDLSEAARLLEGAIELYREAGEARRETRALNSLGIVARNRGDLARARELLTRCLAMRRELGDRRLVSVTLCDLGVVAFDEGDLSDTRRLFEESLAIDRELGDRAGVAVNLGNLSWLALAEGDLDAAPLLMREALAGFEELSDREGVAESLEQIACLAGRRGRPQRAARLAGAAAALRDQIGVPLATAADVDRLERDLARVREELGADRYAAAFAAGNEAGPDTTLDEARAEVEELASLPA
ncbi:MAG: tetratricopeptide repeat protein [Gaiellaceae bacterium]